MGNLLNLVPVKDTEESPILSPLSHISLSKGNGIIKIQEERGLDEVYKEIETKEEFIEYCNKLAGELYD